MQIAAITTAYDPQEDRLYLAIADDQGVSARRWLTPRLLGRLLPTLLQQVQTQIVAPQEIPGEARHAANIYAQLQARLIKKPACPVLVDAQTDSKLIHEINVSLPKAGGATLAFQTGSPCPDTLHLNPQELRQWLEALYNAWLQADWPRNQWPDWIDRPRPPSNSGAQ